MPMRRMAREATLFIVKNEPSVAENQSFTIVFGERLRAFREDTLYSRSDVARVCGITKDNVRQWEDGRAVMPARFWVPVCEMLHIDPWQLLTGRPQPPVPDLPAALRNPNRVAASKKQNNSE